MPIQGIDVSYWQGDIDWDASARSRRRASPSSRRPKAATISIRNSSTTGTRRSVPASRAAPITSSIGAARRDEQALWFMLNVPPDPDALPPVLDLEWNSHSKTCPQQCRARWRSRRSRSCSTRWRRIPASGRSSTPTPKFHRDVLDGRVHRLSFLAALGRRRAGNKYRSRSWAFWQFTTTGTVPGVAGNVDRNSFNGTSATGSAC